jgi:wyosine [tRNA(Phe)-imidazoG37] synthetase (radical SAM superfamily)
MVAGYSAFRREFRGEMWIEVFLVPGLNAAPAEVARIAALCRRLGPDRVHLNTAVRPAAQPDVAPLPNAALRELGALFDPPAEVPSAWESAKRGPPGAKPSDAAILALLARHPTTAAQLAELQQLDGAAVQESLARLLRAGIIGLERRDGVPYYFSRRPAP